MDGYQNSTVVTITPDASMDYHSSEDSYKLFYSEATDNLSIYTLSSDLYALEINAIGESDGLIPVGFRTAKKGTISLSFSNTDGFEDFYLYDSLLDKDILVREGASYSFENTSDELYNDNRLYLKSLRSATGLSNITSNRIVVYPENRKIAVKALFEEEIREVYVYNSQGQVLSGETDIHSNSHSVSIAAEGVYIVVVQGKDSVLTRKVTIW